MLVHGEDNTELGITMTLFFSGHIGSGFPPIWRVTQTRGHNMEGDRKSEYCLYIKQYPHILDFIADSKLITIWYSEISRLGSTTSLGERQI